MEQKSKQVAKISVFITSIFVIFLSISYAFINQTLAGTKRQVITSGNLELELKEGDAITLENALPMYDEVGMIQKSFDFTLTNKADNDTNYILRLKDVMVEDQQRLDTTLIRYGLTKDGVVIKDTLSKLKNSVLDSGRIKENQMITYSLRLWIDSNVEDENLIKGKSLSYQIETEAVQDILKNPNSAEVKLFSSENLGENCKIYDDGTDTFLVGRCNQNYVWYSGKLWRVVLKNNETGAVKMVTDNAITMISYNARNNTAFEDSYMDQWLNQEFLPTLHHYEDYLVVDSIWDATLDSSSTPSRPTGITSVTRTVGLLNSYEYYTTYNNSDGLATYANGYLRSAVLWGLITSYSDWFVRNVHFDGSLSFNNSIYSFGARPSINLKSGISIISGDGTQSNPYRLEGDSQETEGGTTLLSTRYSGEYITFNNELYRIVSVEDSKTKITAVDTPSALSSNQFHSDDTVTSFANASIKTDLENYYQNDIMDSYKSMIEPNTTWYLGIVESGTNYKESICKTVNIEVGASICERTDVIATASVGLSRVGEMFTSQITRETKNYFWTLTPYSTSYVWSVGGYGNLDYLNPDNVCGVRPSMYLKPNIVISSTNTGDGTYEHPYDIELRG